MYPNSVSLTVHQSLSVVLLVVVLTAACSAQRSEGESEATQDARPNSTPRVLEGEQRRQEASTTLEAQQEPADVPDILPDSTEAEEVANIVAVDPYIASGPNGYIPLWQCIAPRHRPSVSNADGLKDAMPYTFQLTEGLLEMVFMRQPPCVKNLLDGGADVNAFRTPADSFGDGPALHLALNQRNWTMAKYLLGRGADPNIKTPYEGHAGKGGGYTALDIAYGSSAPEDIIAELKRHGAIMARY